MPFPSDPSRFLGKTLPCRCGRTHNSTIRFLDLKAGAMNRLADTLRTLGVARPFVFSDLCTHAAAGALTSRLLVDAGFKFFEYILPEETPVPDEVTLGRLLHASCVECDAVIGVGSGTINDLGKYLAFKLGKPYILIATAPSVDGFASDGSALIIDHLKVTLPTKTPIAIIGDPDILCRAPFELIAAGAGDILGKYSALADWRIANIITDEYHCEAIESIVLDAVQSVESLLPRLAERDPEAVAGLTKALVLSGIAMAFTGNSRPASGSEHHLSHYFELLSHANGQPSGLHGLTVGLGTIISLHLYRSLAQAKPDFSYAEQNAARYNASAWADEMRSLFAKSAAGVIELEERTQKNNPSRVLGRIARIRDRRDELQAVISALPSPEYIESVLLSLGAPVTPQALRMDERAIHDAVIGAKEIRDRYTVLQLLFDLGTLRGGAVSACKFLARPTEQKTALITKTALDIIGKTQCFLLDMDGTIYLGNELFPFTRSFLDAVRKSGRDYCFFTNNSSKSKEDYIKKLSGMGIEITAERMLTASHVLLDHLRENYAGKSVYVVGTPALEREFDDWGVERSDTEPDIVVLGFDTTLTYEKLDRACRFIRGGAVYFGVNPDFNCPLEGGDMMPDCGSTARLIAAATGRIPTFFGKPSRYALDYVSKMTGTPLSGLTMIGDRLYTDIALTYGTPSSSVLVLTGEATAADAARSDTPPDLVIPSLETLSGLLR